MCQACSQKILIGKVGAKEMPAKKPLSEARKKANAKYLSKFAEMRIRLEPDYYEKIKRHAESMGESGAAFAKRAMLRPWSVTSGENKHFQ